MGKKKAKKIPQGYKGELPDIVYIPDNSPEANKKMLEKLEKKSRKRGSK